MNSDAAAVVFARAHLRATLCAIPYTRYLRGVQSQAPAIRASAIEDRRRPIALAHRRRKVVSTDSGGEASSAILRAESYKRRAERTTWIVPVVEGPSLRDRATGS
jgi:hypothetical protein